MARYGLAGALLATAAIVTACSGDESVTTTSSTSTTQEPTLGELITFSRADGGDTVGTIRFHEAVMLPAECTWDDEQVLGLRVDIDNPGDIYLPAPDAFQLQTVDEGGYTRDVEHTTIESECDPTYPEIARSDPRSKTEGWALVKVESPPTAVVFQPLVAEPDSTIENIKFVPVAPQSVKIPLPGLATAPAPATTVAPTTTTTPPPPPVVIETQEISYPEAGESCDTSTDTWALDSSGGQLRCAYAGGPTSKWVNSAPFIGVREEGSPCDMSESGVAETADGTPMVCVGSRGDSVWMPGP
ncbi:hypothetical protein [Nocardia sp. CA-290969]|uniref:hypothetical protein n=1 Tax=Nocardia sp. CA-290969 TaxID=3239986 RepID=UPI003D89E0C1